MNTRGLWVAALLLVGVLVAATLFADAQRLVDAARTYPWWRVGAALGLATANYGLRTVRFRQYMARLGTRLGWGEAFLIFVAGFLFTVTPGKMGEVFKAWLLQRRRDVPLTTTATAVVAERVTDVMGLLVIASFGVVQYGAHVGLFVGILAFTAALLLAVAHPRALPATLTWLQRRFGGRVGLLDRALAAGHEVHRVLRVLCAPRLLVSAVLLATAGWMLEACAFRVLLDGLPAGGSLGGATVIYAMATLFGAASMLPGGVGGTEAVFVALSLQPAFGFGIDRASATLVTLLIRFATLWWAVIFGGVCWALLRRMPTLAAAGAGSPATPTGHR